MADTKIRVALLFSTTFASSSKLGRDVVSCTEQPVVVNSCSSIMPATASDSSRAGKQRMRSCGGDTMSVLAPVGSVRSLIS